MALFQRVEALEAALKALPATSGVTTEQLAAVQTQVDGLRTDVGTPSN